MVSCRPTGFLGSCSSQLPKMQCIENDLMKGHIKYFSFLELLCHWIIGKNRNKQAKKRTVLFSIKDNNKPSIFLEKRYIIAFSLSQFGNRKWNRKWFYISFCMQIRKTLMLCQKLSQQCESRNKFHPRRSVWEVCNK